MGPLDLITDAITLPGWESRFAAPVTRIIAADELPLPGTVS